MDKLASVTSENIDLSVFFYTQSQAKDFLARLSLIIAEIYKTGFNLELVLQQQLGIQKKDKFITLLRNCKVDPNSPGDLKLFLEKIQKIASEVPTLTLEVAFEPRAQTMEALNEWFAINLKRQVLFEFVVKPEIIGGAQITFKGKYHDGSLRDKIDQALENVLHPRRAASAAQAPVNQQVRQNVESIHT